MFQVEGDRKEQVLPDRVAKDLAAMGVVCDRLQPASIGRLQLRNGRAGADSRVGPVGPVPGGDLDRPVGRPREVRRDVSHAVRHHRVAGRLLEGHLAVRRAPELLVGEIGQAELRALDRRRRDRHRSGSRGSGRKEPPDRRNGRSEHRQGRDESPAARSPPGEHLPGEGRTGGLDQLAAGRVPVVGRLRERGREDAVEGLRKLGPEIGQERRRLVQVGEHDRELALAVERARSGKALVEDAAE